MLNNVTIVGRLTRDPEIRQTNNGNSVGNFTIANDYGVINGEKQTLFISVSLFGKQVDTLQKFFFKGSLIGLTGRLTQRKYTNKNGVEVTATEIHAERIEFVDSKSSSQAEGGETVQDTAKKVDAFIEDEDSLPF